MDSHFLYSTRCGPSVSGASRAVHQQPRFPDRFCWWACTRRWTGNFVHCNKGRDGLNRTRRPLQGTASQPRGLGAARRAGAADDAAAAAQRCTGWCRAPTKTTRLNCPWTLVSKYRIQNEFPVATRTLSPLARD